MPKNRKNLVELNDLIWKLKNAIKVKLELEKQIDLYSKLISSLLRKSILDIILMSVLPHRYKIKRLKLQIEHSDLQMKLDVTLKNRNIYHRNEMQLEEHFKDIYTDMEENYNDFVDQLEKVYSNASSDNLDIYPDVQKLYDNYKANPPKDKVDKISFYLTLENTLYRVYQY